MTVHNAWARSLRPLFITFLVATLVACGGGGGGGSSTVATPLPPVETPPPADATGTVGILITDMPTTDYSGVLITVTSILLLSDDGQVPIWTGEETFDLLDLEHFRDVFAIDDEVPVGVYEKVRLRVNNVTLVKGEGDNEELFPVKLPANGKIDLKPREPFEVLPDSVLWLEIDIDAKRSIHVVQTGNGGYRFRPVVFVNVLSAPDTEKLTRIHGVVQDLDRDEADFELCLTEIVVDPDNGDDDYDEEHCIDVETDEETSYFSGVDGEEVSLDQLSEGDEATVIGFFALDDEDDDGDDGDEGEDDDEYESPFVLKAVVVEIGPLGSFQMLTGTVTDAPDAENDFPMLLDDGQGFESGYTPTVATSDGTKVFSSGSVPLTIADVEIDDRATVDAVVAAGDILRTALIILDKEAPGPEEIRVAGVVVDPDDDTRTFQLTTDDVEAGTACVFVPEDADIIQEPADEEGDYEMVDFDAIDDGDEATVFGFEEEGCVTASIIILSPPPSDGGT